MGLNRDGNSDVNMFKDINIEDALAMENRCLVDVRSPAEYEEATIPGAINIPLFADGERRLLGTIYREEGPAKAKMAGLEMASPRLAELVGSIISSCQGKTPIIFCWRGGMRSRALTAIFASLAMDVYRIKGGYKAFRRLVLREFATYRLQAEVLILDGLTGVGKTMILRRLQSRGHPVLDLEALAGHRGSVFGGLGIMQQKGQKTFDALLWERLGELRGSSHLLMEGESKRIGRVYLPDFLYCAIRGGKRIKVEASLALRVERILQDYAHVGPTVGREIEGALARLTKRLGKNLVAHLKSMLKEGNIDTFVETLLVSYYDPLYRRSQLSERNYELLVGADDIDGAVAKIEAYLRENYPG